MKIKRRRIILKSLLCLALCLILGGGVILSAFPLKASAASTTYSNVLDDLSSAENFDVSKYPSDNTDFSINVIQIAESSDNELFIYTYQPNALYKFLLVTSIVFSDEKDINDRVYREYQLSLVSKENTLCKYKVLDYTVPDSSEREYSISVLYRYYDSLIDEDEPSNNTITRKALAIGQLWKAKTTSEGVSYSVEYEDLIIPSSFYVGEILYSGLSGITYVRDSVYSHYVAFSTKRKMDDIIDADVVYSAISHSIKPSSIGITTTHTKTEVANNKLVTVSKSEIISDETEGIFYEKYTYSRIQKVADFIKNEEEFSEEISYALADKQWVFRFLETDYHDSLQGNHNDATGLVTYTGELKYTEVTDVAIFRIKYVYKEDVYNLGVVTNKQSSDGLPDNNNNPLNIEFKFSDEVKESFFLLMLLVAIIALWNPFITVIKLIWSAVKFLLNLLFEVLSLPFRILYALFKEK